MKTFDDTIAEAFTRTVTRRTLLRRGMRWSLGAGVALSTAWGTTSTAKAAGCGGGGITTSSCYCEPTIGCGAGKCCFDTANACCGGAVPRCDAWTSIPYCWCSKTCCIGQFTGYYSCCDCWQSGSGSCSQSGGRVACICGHRHITGSC